MIQIDNLPVIIDGVFANAEQMLRSHGATDLEVATELLRLAASILESFDAWCVATAAPCDRDA